MKQSEWLRRPIEATSDHPYIILDSGAYSVWKSGAKVDLDRYAAYCATVANETLTCVNLDAIPGSANQRATPADVEDAAQVSFQRWLALQSSGALIMPVFHQTDDMRWLYRYCEAGAEYIGISPTDSFHASVRQDWLGYIHEYITTHRPAGRVLGKDLFTHALGVFSPNAVTRNMGLWSADASTILRYVAWKRILLPQFERGIDPRSQLPRNKPAAPARVVGWEPVYTGTRGNSNLATTMNIDWDYVADYLDDHGFHDQYTRNAAERDRVMIDDLGVLMSVTLELARDITAQSGVRCFVAGQIPLAIWQITVPERYPYILRSYAVIKESHGETIKRIYRRDWQKPPRRPDRDHKVEPPRGLFS